MDNNLQNIDYSNLNDKMLKTEEDVFVCDSKINSDSLFQATTIGGIDVKNKFCFHNLTDNFLFDTLGNPTEKFIQFYENIAKSDVGLIFCGGVYVGEKHNKSINIKPKISDSASVKNCFSKLTDSIHTSGSKIFLTIKSLYGRGDKKNKFLNVFPLSVSNIKSYFEAKIPCLRISDGKCGQIIKEIGETSLLACETGFDGILVDANAFGLIGEFSNLEFNKRTLGYYSEIYDFSLKIAKEVISNNKNQVLFFNLTISNMFDFVYKKSANNIKTIKNLIKKQTKNEFFELLLRLVQVGVDGFVFEMGTFESEFLKNFNEFQKEELYNEIALEIRNFFKSINLTTKFDTPVSVIVKDNFNTISSMSRAIQLKATDFVDVTKNIYSDLNFLKNIKTQKVVKNCLKCSKCVNLANNFDFVDCTVNPNLSFDSLIKSSFFQNNKVAVVGSGIAGLNACLILADRGFSVDLFERYDTLNKNGRKCEIFGFNSLLKNYNDYIENKIFELEKDKKLNIFFNTSFDVKNVNTNKYNSIIVATGYHEKFFNVSGAVLKNVKSIYDVLDNEDFFMYKNSIVLNAMSELSLKLAIYLLNQNKKVSIIVQSMDFLLNLPNDRLTYYLFILKKLRAKIFLYSRVKFIQEDFVEIVSNNKLRNEDFQTIVMNVKSGTRYSFEPKVRNVDCDAFIYEPELYSNNKLYYDLVKANFAGELFLIGNSLQIQDMAEDIKSAYYVAKNL